MKANAREFRGLTFWDVFKNYYLIMVLSTLKNRETKISNDKPTEQENKFCRAGKYISSLILLGSPSRTLTVFVGN
jgi:hypothetical protein